MSDLPINVRIPPDLRDLIDQARGDIPRERWIRRALENALRVSAVAADRVTVDDSGIARPFREILEDTPSLHYAPRAHPQSCRCGVCQALKGKR